MAITNKTNIQILASGSDGNQVVFEYKGYFLVIDAGVDYFSAPVSQTEGIIITHYHKDHSLYREWYMERGYNMISLEPKNYFTPITNPSIKTEPMVLGVFSIVGIHTTHGWTPNRALIIYNNLTGEKFFYATDLDMLPKNFFALKGKFDKILIEINYDNETLSNDDEINLNHLNRKIETHMSFETFVEQKVIEKSDEFIILHFNQKYLNIEKVREYFEKNNKKVFFYINNNN